MADSIAVDPVDPAADETEYTRAAPPRPEPPSPLHDRLRVLSAEARDLREVLASIARGEATLAHHAEYIKTTSRQMDDLMSRLDGDNDDEIRHIQNVWEQMRTSKLLSAPDTPFQPEEQVQLLNLLDGQCRRMIYWTGYKTIPARLQDWLDSTQPGYVIPFHAVFEDEMPDAEDRQRILQYLAWAPDSLRGGVVDPDEGLVYRYDDSPFKRSLSFLYIGAVLAITAGIVFLWRYLPTPQTGLDAALLLAGWAAVLLGALVHVVIGTAKRLRGQGAGPAVLPVGRFAVMVNARLGFILLRIFLALIGYFTLVYSGIISLAAPGAFLFNAFLVGYSLDSVLELFSSGMDRYAAAQQASFSRQLEANR